MDNFNQHRSQPITEKYDGRDPDTQMRILNKIKEPMLYLVPSFRVHFHSFYGVCSRFSYMKTLISM